MWLLLDFPGGQKKKKFLKKNIECVEMGFARLQTLNQQEK